MTINTKPSLNVSKLIPKDIEGVRQWLSTLYDDLTSMTQNNDNLSFSIAVTSTPNNLPFAPSFGSFIVLVSGQNSTQPSLAVAGAKSTKDSAGTITELSTQAGTGTWAGVSLSITSTATNFQIAHDGAASLSGGFWIKLIGTRSRTDADV